MDAGSIPAASTIFHRDSGRFADRGLGATQTRLISRARRQAGSVGFEDTREPFAQHAERLFNKNDFAHPNARGAELIAELIFEKLLTLRWLDPEPGARR